MNAIDIFICTITLIVYRTVQLTTCSYMQATDNLKMPLYHSKTCYTYCILYYQKSKVAELHYRTVHQLSSQPQLPNDQKRQAIKKERISLKQIDTTCYLKNAKCCPSSAATRQAKSRTTQLLDYWISNLLTSVLQKFQKYVEHNLNIEF